MVNNPILFNDPTGHYPTNCGPDNIYCGGLAENDYYHRPAPSSSEPEEKLIKNNDKPCNKSDNVIECAWKRVKSGPDYISLNVPIPILYGLAGFDVIITRDYYNNWYIGGGLAAATWGGDLGFGWFLTDERSEESLEGNLAGHSFTGSGGYGIGAGFNNTDPTFIHPEMSHQTKPEDAALEAELTTPGGSLVYTYSIFLYDNGNPDPWLPIIPRFWR